MYNRICTIKAWKHVIRYQKEYKYYFQLFFHRSTGSGDHSRLGRVPKVSQRRTSANCRCQTFYRLNAVPIIQPTCQSTERINRVTYILF